MSAGTYRVLERNTEEPWTELDQVGQLDQDKNFTPILPFSLITKIPFSSLYLKLEFKLQNF